MSFASCGYSGGAMMDVVASNVQLLQERGIFEPALVTAFCGCKRYLDRQQQSAFESLLNRADREKLRNLGKPLSVSFPVAIYRGTNVREATGRRCGWSWTLDLDMACKFACGHAKNRVVLTAQLDQDEILWFNPDRGEQEVVCRPQAFQRYAVSRSELVMRSQRAVDQMTQRNRTRLIECENRRRENADG